MWVIFLVARTVPPSFVDYGPKLRVLILAIGNWPVMAKNRGEPQKMTPISEMEIFLGEIFIWGSLECAKNWHFWPHICLSGPLWCYARPMGARCLVGFLICEYQNFYCLSKKLGQCPKNGHIWAKICICGHFGPNIGPSDPFDAMPGQKKNNISLKVYKKSKIWKRV